MQFRRHVTLEREKEPLAAPRGRCTHDRFFLTLSLLLALAAGCSTSERRDHAAVEAAASATASSSGGSGLYDLPDMRKARTARERGAREMERAYQTKDTLQRENAFSMAWTDFRSAEEAYHDTLTVAAPRFRPVIQNEIDQVAQYMRQIQRDRAEPRVD